MALCKNTAYMFIGRLDTLAVCNGSSHTRQGRLGISRHLTGVDELSLLQSAIEFFAF